MAQQIIRAIGQSLHQQHGSNAAQFMLQASQPSFQALISDPNQIHQLCIQNINTRPYDQIISSHIRSAYHSSRQQHEEAIKLQASGAELLYAAMEADKDNWNLPVINIFFRALRLISYQADAQLEAQGQKPRHMIETQDVLKRFLQKMVIDRTMPMENSKKMGCLFVINHLFKLYFKLNNLKLCTFLIKMVKQLPPLNLYPKAQVITYKYYLGRLNVFEEKYDEAEECLEYAFKHCQKQSVGNKKRILQFLVPVKLLKSKYPQERLLSKYHLLEFQNLIQSIRNGDLEKFNTNLALNQRFFIQKGIYLILEKLKIFVYRNLFRKVYLFHASSVTEEKLKTQLPLDTLLAALRVNGTEMSMDELECILANLIFQNNIRGYIAHKRCVVLSAKDPFPKVS